MRGEDAGGMSENRLCGCCPCGDRKRRGAVDSEVGGSAGISEKLLIFLSDNLRVVEQKNERKKQNKRMI